MKRRLTILALFAAVPGLVLYALIHSSAARTGPVAASAPDMLAPPFELKALDGRTVRLAGFRGRAVLVNFWATYCAPCRVEMPWLEELYLRYKPRGLEIVGISLSDGSERAVAQFVREINVEYPIVLGNRKVADAYGGIPYLPESFFIDRAGRITHHEYGMQSKSQFEAAIQELLAPPNTR
jgi:cytochrome c biogenesis protein CcmG/thiol:disulfide interchange protein DsbE